jgi:hypothetical protein
LLCGGLLGHPHQFGTLLIARIAVSAETSLAPCAVTVAINSDHSTLNPCSTVALLTNLHDHLLVGNTGYQGTVMFLASLVFPIFVKGLSPPKADPPSEEKIKKNSTQNLRFWRRLCFIFCFTYAEKLPPPRIIILIIIPAANMSLCITLTL